MYSSIQKDSGSERSLELVIQTSKLRIHGIQWDMTRRWRKKLRPYCVLHFNGDKFDVPSSPCAFLSCVAKEGEELPQSPQKESALFCLTPPSKVWPLEKSDLLQTHARYSPTLLNYASDEERSRRRCLPEQQSNRKLYLKSLGGGVRKRSISADGAIRPLQFPMPSASGDGSRQSMVQVWPYPFDGDNPEEPHKCIITVEVHNKVILSEHRSFSQPSSPHESDQDEDNFEMKMSHPLCLGSIQVPLTFMHGEAVEDWYQIPLNVCSLSSSWRSQNAEEKPQAIWAEIRISAMVRNSEEDSLEGKTQVPRNLIKEKLLQSRITNDNFGFPIRQGCLLDWHSFQKLEALRHSILRSRWEQLQELWTGTSQSLREDQSKVEALQCLSWIGIPLDMKEEVCMYQSGAAHQRLEAGVGYYQNLVSQIAMVERQMFQEVDPGSSQTVSSVFNVHGRWNIDDSLESHDVPTVPQSESSSSLGDSDCCPVCLSDGFETCSQMSDETDKKCIFNHDTEFQPLIHVPDKDESSEHAKADNIFLDAEEKKPPDSSKQSVNSVDDHSSNEILKDWVEVDYTSPTTDFKRVWKEIDLDLPRTFGNHSSSIVESTKASLGRVLKAYAQHNPRVGYCQGLNFLTGVLVTAFSEETAFWLLATLCDSINPGYYDPSMKLARADTAVLKVILTQDLPDLCLHFETIGLPIELLYTQWLLVHFVNCMPNKTALRILELVFVERSPFVTMAVAVAFFRLHRSVLLSIHEMMALVDYVSSTLAEMWDTDQLFAEAQDIFRAPSWKPRVEKLRAWQKNTKASSVLKHAGTWGDLLGRCTFLYTNSLLEEGRLGKSPLAPLMLRGLQWVMGWNS